MIKKRYKIFVICFLCIALISCVFYAKKYVFCKTIALGQFNGTEIGSIKVEALWLHECHNQCIAGILSPNGTVHFAAFYYTGNTSLKDIENMNKLPSDIFSECKIEDYYSEKTSPSEYKIIKADLSALNHTLKDYKHHDVISEYSYEYIWHNNKYVCFDTSYVDGGFKTDEQSSAWVDVVHGNNHIEMSNISFFFVHKLLNSERWLEEDIDTSEKWAEYNNNKASKNAKWIYAGFLFQ